MSGPLDHLPPLERYSAAAEQTAQGIIGAYSTSFGMATRLLGPRHRSHVRNIYAMVRIADELVDGVATEAGLSHTQQHEALESFVCDTEEALGTGFSTNPVIHAFARTARAARIDTSLTTPFFDSMRADLARAQATSGQIIGFSPAEHSSYVYGSAEVVGLMCLRVFTREETLTRDQSAVLEQGARQLGAAFQNVNFLRDLADDTDRLGRSYLSVAGRLTEVERVEWVATIRAQLADARASLHLLPRDAALAVRSALDLFAALTDHIERTSVTRLYRERVRLSGFRKARVLAGSIVAQWRQA